jgi:hypothetical protein
VMFLFLPLMAACWLLALRVAFMLVMARAGWLPTLGAPS